MKSSQAISLTVAASAAMMLLVAAPASAHTSLIDVQPVEGDTVGKGTSVTLTFSDDLLGLGTEMTVTDAIGDSVPLQVRRPGPASVEATLPALAAGPVTVSWRVVAGDGHPIEGTLNYVAEASETSPPDASMASASASPDQVSATASMSPAPATPPPADDAGSDRGVNWAVWIAVAVAILATTAVATLTKRRR
ncbi:copper resistance CopC family protein [Demequina sp.]|uniref:copper resistance CopC family protein n=1 Tax=Demequina sp. TaxID=2050685 RepID=UPI0025BEAFBB|nr:copper resistance CopC family protein [Demequina sp.]